MISLPRLFLLILLAGMWAETAARGADWPNFRGPFTDSVAQRDTLPTTFSSSNIRWTASLPGRGLSGPTVLGSQVFVTACTGAEQERLHVLCFDARTGKRLWQRETWATGRTMCHGSMSVAAPQPAAQGQLLVASFSSNDVVCYDLQGNLQWFRGLAHDYPNANNSLGMASSPLIVGSTVLVQVESDSEAFVVGLDLETGVNRWKLDRPPVASWTSPTLLRTSAGVPSVLLQSSHELTAVEPATGKMLWKFGEPCATIPTVTTAEGIVYVPSGGVTALPPPQSATSSVKPLWSSGKLSPATASPVVVRRQVFTVNKSGVLSCGDITTGKVLWQLRLSGRFSSTPVAAGGHLYLFNEAGNLFVVLPEVERGQIVSQYDLKETVLASPAVAENALYIRSDGRLWKLAAAPQ